MNWLHCRPCSCARRYRFPEASQQVLANAVVSSYLVNTVDVKVGEDSVREGARGKGCSEEKSLLDGQHLAMVWFRKVSW